MERVGSLCHEPQAVVARSGIMTRYLIISPEAVFWIIFNQAILDREQVAKRRHSLVSERKSLVG
jgi:hypothetical protein